MLEPACGSPSVSSGGQASAQGPSHADLPFLSFSNKYSVIPLPSTRIEPKLTFLASTVAPPMVALPAEGVAALPLLPSSGAMLDAAGAPDGSVAVVESPPPPQAAVSN